jgi:protein involved in polysaccharide export with SLBB domain
MNVFVAGEVTKSSWVGITGLTRLSEVVTPLLTRYSSLRDVTVKSLNGAVKTYDLFKAERYGDISQNPFLEPGDEIRVKQLSMLVTIDGEVRRPGSYQLLPGEGLKELIEVYAQGFTEKANPQRLGLVRYVSESSPVGEKHELNYETNKDFKVHIYDVITVPSKQDLMPVIWFEGAVGLSSTGASPETSQRIPFTFFPGETLSQAALANRKLFSAVSDLSKAYIIRSDGTHIPVDISKFIYNFDLSGDIILQQNDIIIVPFRQFFVSVSGAVRYPGRYPYIPDRTWEYYIGLAGGFDTERNGNQKITIYDVNSKKVEQTNRMIQPEDNIVAASNSFTYQLMRISTILSTVLSLVAIIVNLTGLKL